MKNFLKDDKMKIKEAFDGNNKRYTFNITAYPTDTLCSPKIHLRDIPLNVREKLAEEIIKYPSNQIIVHNEESNE